MVKKKKVPQKYVSNLYAIPQPIKEDLLSLCLSKQQFQRAVIFLSVLRTKALRLEGHPCAQISLSRNYLRKVLTTNYNVLINILVGNGILYRDDYYNQEKSITKKYSLSPKYYIENLTNSRVDNNNKVEKGKEMAYFNYKCLKDLDSIENEELTKGQKDILKRLKFDINQLQNLAKTMVDKTSLVDFKIDGQITETSFKVKQVLGQVLCSRWTTLDKALKLAKFHNISLIQDRNTFYLMNKTIFLTMKKNMQRLSYEEAITRIEKGYWTASRNSTNNRLDTNITNLHGKLLDVILEDNGLIQIDLSNSQFAILANELPEELQHPTTLEFREAAFNGQFYECVQSKLGLNNRMDAKTASFEVLFSSYKNRSEQLKKMKAEFPELMQYIEDYKKAHGSNNFSIDLQKKEAEIFIDGILTDLMKKGLFCLSKHDSIILKKEDLDTVLEVINYNFTLKNFKGNLVY